MNTPLHISHPALGEANIEKALAVLQQCKLPTSAWRVHATRSDLYRQKQHETAAEAQRARAEAIIVALANSFAPDEPLSRAFLMTPLVQRMRRGEAGSKDRREHPLA